MAAATVASTSATTASGAEANEEDEPLVTILPQEVIDALAELDLELSEGKPGPKKMQHLENRNIFQHYSS